MKKKRTVIFCLLFLLSAGIASAANEERQRLRKMFEEAEQCYLTDDYEQLKLHMDEYYTLYDKSRAVLGDSAEVFYAYYCKMRGAWYYGLAKETDYYSRWAERYYRASLKIFADRSSSQNVITIREELAQLYYKVKDYDKALQQLDTIFNYYDYVIHYLGIRDERLDDSDDTSFETDYYRTLSQMAICNARLGHFDTSLQQIAEAQDYFRKKKSEFYYETLRRQGKILMLQADSVGTDRYKEARRCYERYVNEEYTSIAQRLDTMTAAHRAQHWLANHRFLYDCYRLGSHAPELLYDLALFSKGWLLAYESNRQAQQVRWQEVRKRLTAKDCALEFVQYFGRHDEKRMGCLILRNSGKPLFIDLFATDSLLSLKLTSPYTVGDAFDTYNSDIKDTLYRDSRLPGLVWSPRLMAAIGNAERVYFAPDGLIHQWAIEYLMPDSQKVCYRLSSTRNLVRRPPALKMQSAIFCGGMDYSAAYHPMGTDNDFMAYRYLKPRVGSINELPYTRVEVDSIYACRQRDGHTGDAPSPCLPAKDTLFVGAAATDECLLQLLRQKQYDIVHITTHGHYIGQIDIHNDLRPLTEDLSLSRCGMLFAGAANTLSNDSFDDSRDDAILSGKELARQDFSKTELVVLNCCQTAQGRLTEDGIYGLQRALKQAGANAMLISLWNLSDYSSAQFLRFFYEEVQRQQPGKIRLHDALAAARKRLMAHERKFVTLDNATLGLKLETLRFNTPRHAFPFVLVDAF